ncbi:restriction endonuclease subunit S [Streptomyces malaysiensis]|uniref:restriction endonuclease subunit S n=1 Tax=Streptomyces malaysiensis TaxID=92644 RepID=UPI00369E429D
MTENWSNAPLGSIIRLKRGFDLPAVSRVPGSFPVVGSAGISGWHSEGPVKGPGVVIGRSGSSMGCATYVEDDYWPLNTAMYVEDFLGNHPRYVYLLLTTLDFKAFNSGSAQQSLNRNYIADIPISLPPRREQRAIAEVLGALDNKIAVNERISVTVSSLSRALLGALWAEGEVASLAGDTPAPAPGWRRITLGELCTAGGGGIQTGPFGSQLHAADYVDRGTPSVMPQNIGDNFINDAGIARIGDEDIRRLSKYLLSEGDIVYSRRGDVKRRALVRTLESGWLCGTGCLRVRTGGLVEPLFLSHYLGEPEIQEWILQHAIGATMPNLNTSILGAVPVVLPPAELRDRVNGELAALDARAMNGLRENRTLAELRDTLLPKLISGQIRIKDAERAVEEVV